MPKMTFILKDGTRQEVEAPLGLSVLEIAHRHHIEVEGACEGSLACSTCHVYVEKGAECLSEPTEAEEDRVERVVSRDLIHEHEETAEGFLWAAIAVTALVGSVLVAPKQNLRNGLMVASIAATLVVAGLAIQTGHSGGSLVYRHGAANAYRD